MFIVPSSSKKNPKPNDWVSEYSFPAVTAVEADKFKGYGIINRTSNFKPDFESVFGNPG